MLTKAWIYLLTESKVSLSMGQRGQPEGMLDLGSAQDSEIAHVRGRGKGEEITLKL